MNDAVFHELQRHWEEEGYCPSVDELAANVGASQSTVLRALHALEDRGHIERFQHYRGWRIVDGHSLPKNKKT